jgi:hypothetical protein
MPVKKRRPNIRSNRPDLVNRLAAELDRDSQDKIAGVPDIYEDYVPRSDRFSVTVVWDAWHDVLPEQRGKTIMDAYEQSNRREDVVNVNATLGVTPSEAAKLGLLVSETSK